MKCTPFYKPQFGEDVKTYASLKKQIEKKVESIISDPYLNTETLEKKDGHIPYKTFYDRINQPKVLAKC